MKPLEEFNRTGRGRLGYCKPCMAAKQSAARKKKANQAPIDPPDLEAPEMGRPSARAPGAPIPGVTGHISIPDGWRKTA